MKKFRFIQLISGFNYIHHFHYSFGFKLPFVEIAYFKNLGFKKINVSNLKDKNGKLIEKPYHNCTLSGIY